MSSKVFNTLYGHRFTDAEVMKLLVDCEDEEVFEFLEENKSDPIGVWYRIDKSDDSDNPYELTFWRGNFLDLMEMDCYTENFKSISEAKTYGEKFVTIELSNSLGDNYVIR
jgi:hypothetical protein